MGPRSGLDGMVKLRPKGIRFLDRRPVASRLNEVNRLIKTVRLVVYVQSNTHLLCNNILKTQILQSVYGHIRTAVSLGPKSAVLCNLQENVTTERDNIMIQCMLTFKRVLYSHSPKTINLRAECKLHN